MGKPSATRTRAGLPHGCKPPPPPPPPPPLAMQHPCTAGPQKPRTMATVSPLHQVVPPQPNLSPYEAAGGLNAFGPSQRTSSFAAALRKLAKQAGDPITGEKDIAPISPVSSPALAQRSLTPKRNGQSGAQNQPMYLSSTGHQVNNTSFPSSSPPVVTIAPSRPHPSHTTDSRKLQVMDLGSLPQANATASSVSNGHLPDPLSLKLDSSKSGSRSSSVEKWEDHANKSIPTSSVSSQSRPHATIAPLPRPDDSLTSSRGFQPYRSADDIRTSLPHHLSSFEHHPPAAYPYTPAFLPPPHLPHPAYRLDDALFLDRYGLLRSQVMPFPAQPGMMAAPAAFYPQSRYDLLAQSLSLSSANNSLLHHERLKLEEQRQREKEAELDHSRKRELERREKEQKEKEHKDREKEHKEKEKEHKEKDKERREKSHREKSDHTEHKSTNHSSAVHSKRVEYPSVRNESLVQVASSHSSPPVTSSSAPLNLVVHPNNTITNSAANSNSIISSNNINTSHNVADPPKKEAELWLPWQQHHTPNSNNHHIPNNIVNTHEENAPNLTPPYKSTVLPQENIKPPLPKESAVPVEKFHAPYNMPFFAEKKHCSMDVSNADFDVKKHLPYHAITNNNRKFDSIHHHITELSKKDNSSNEWKHEKLQKACTNNHRKTVNEVKKLREESHHHHYPTPPAAPSTNPSTITTTATATITTSPINNTHPVHHRKHLNGIVKPMLSQDEGMHARLLETEKCRIEFNSLVANKLQQPDKLQVPNLIHGAVQVNGKEVNHQMMYMDYNHHLMSVFKQSVETTPVISKLDKEAEDLKKKGSADGDREETPIKDFLILSKGPPLPLDTNPMKMKYLNFLGLTSRLKRKKIELDIFLKRRKHLMEEPTTPPSINLILEKENVSMNSRPLTEVLKDAEMLSDKLRGEITTAKIEFFANLGLTPATIPQKEEKARVRKVVEDERNRRQQRIQNKAKQKISPSAPVPEAEKDPVVKEEVTATSELIPVNSKDNKLSQSSQNPVVQGDQVPYVRSPQKDEPSACKRALSSNECWDLSQGKVWNKYSFKRGHSLKCEANPPALPLAAQNNQQTSNKSLELKNEAKSSPNSHISTGTQVDLFATLNNVCNKKGKSKTFSFNWPGLDAIIEAYYRHNKEQLLEQEVLKKKCNQLRTKQEELKKEASSCSKTMSDLLKLKRELEEQRSQNEQAIEKLKLFIQSGR